MVYSYTSVTWHENEFTPRWCKRTPFQRWWNTKMVLTQLHKFTLFWCHHSTLTFCVCFHAPLLYFFKITFYTSLTLLDIDECSKGSHDCDGNANCTNTNGSHSCTCKEGYTGKGESCQGKLDRFWKKENNCLSQTIVLLSNRLFNIFFSSQLPFANRLFS